MKKKKIKDGEIDIYTASLYEAYMELRKRNMLQNEEGLSTLLNDIDE